MKFTFLIAIAVLLIVASPKSNPVHAQSLLNAPSNIVAASGAEPGEVHISWNPVSDASYYRVGWVAYPDYQAAAAANRDWLEIFAFVDVANRGQTSHTVTRLTPGVNYYFIVASNSSRYGAPQWSVWASLQLSEAPPQPGTTCPLVCPAMPTQEPITFSGHGNGSPRVSLTEPGVYTVSLNVVGNRGRFGNATFDADLTEVNGVDDRDISPFYRWDLDGNGNWSGETTVRVGPGSPYSSLVPGEYVLEVEATGSWSISLTLNRLDDTVDPSQLRFAGRGYDVQRVSLSQGVYQVRVRNTGNPDGDHLYVDLIGLATADTERIFNESSPNYAGVAGVNVLTQSDDVPPGEYLLEVEATGDWEIIFEKVS